MGLHEQSAHHASVFGPKAWVPGAGLHLQGRPAASAGLRPAARGPWLSTLASAFRGAPSPWRVSAGPVGGIIRRPPPGRAGARLARSRGPRAPALEYLHTIRQDRCLISLEVRRPSPSGSEVPPHPADCAGLRHSWWPCYNTRITQAPPLICLFIEMASCVEEKLASMSESSFQDKAIRFLFLLNNSYFILELKEGLRGHAHEPFWQSSLVKSRDIWRAICRYLGHPWVLLV